MSQKSMQHRSKLKSNFCTWWCISKIMKRSYQHFLPMFFSSYFIACFSNIFAMSVMQWLYWNILGQTNIKQDGLFYPFERKEVKRKVTQFDTDFPHRKIDKGSKYFPWKKPTPYIVSWAQIRRFQASLQSCHLINTEKFKNKHFELLKIVSGIIRKYFMASFWAYMSFLA